MMCSETSHEEIIAFNLEPSWQKVLRSELTKPYLIRLASFVKTERIQEKKVYPPEHLVFNAFLQTPFDTVSVVIMGQDPYHGAGQAHGLSFSVPQGVKPPPSLQNIFKELNDDIGMPIPNHGCLLPWAKQGVLLLNATLTVEEKEPLSHHKKGWEEFTNAVVAAIAKKSEPVIFVLWGKNAQEKCLHVPELKAAKHHSILTAAHPSPFSAHNGFFGCKHFSKINKILQENGKKPIEWSL